MKYVFLSLLLLTPALSFADVRIMGIVSRDSDSDYYSILDQDNGQKYDVDLSFEPGGSVCGQALRFEQEMTSAIRRLVILTGDFKTLSTSETVLEVDVDHITIVTP